MDIPFDLTCWYLNSRRVMELVGANYLVPRLQTLGRLDGITRANAELDVHKDAVVKWLQANNPPPLGKLIAEDRLKEGIVFTHYTNYFFKGLTEVRASLERGKDHHPMATGYAKIDDWRPHGKLTFSFSHEHLTSHSAWSELSGQRRVMMLGVITKIDGLNSEVKPYVIAVPMTGATGWDDYGQYWRNHLEVHIDSIDTFSRVSDLTGLASNYDLGLLRNISEVDVKKAFADIIGELTVPKDWGGESSDLFSTRVLFKENRISTAFVFKGPSKFKPMTMSELGKNGDQINRLFTEPADLFVLQHCHEITPPVRNTMRAFAEQTGRPKLFCLIDGRDTLRILKAYNQCGLCAE